MSEPIHEPGLTSFEAALASLTPRPAAINRDALLFRAGQESVKRRWLWPTTSGVLAAVAAFLAITHIWRPPEKVYEVQLMLVDAPAKSQFSSNPLTTNSAARYSTKDTVLERSSPVHGYRAAQDQLLRWGLDAIPSPYRLVADRPATDRSFRSTEPPASGWPWLQDLFGSGERS